MEVLNAIKRKERKRLKERGWQCSSCVTHTTRPLPRRSRQQGHPTFSSLSPFLSFTLDNSPFLSLPPLRYWIPILWCPRERRRSRCKLLFANLEEIRARGAVSSRRVPVRATRGTTVPSYAGFYAQIKVRIDCRLVQMHTDAKLYRIFQKPDHGVSRLGPRYFHVHLVYSDICGNIFLASLLRLVYL